MSILRGGKKEVSGFWLFFCITLVVRQRFCSLSGLVGSVNNTSTVSKGQAARFSAHSPHPPSPKRKVNAFVCKLFLKNHMLLSTCYFCWCCLHLFQMCLSTLCSFSSGLRYVQHLWPCFHRSLLGSSGVSLACLDDLTRQFQILWQCPMLQFEAGCWSTLSMQELLSTWKEFISKLRSKHRSLLRRGLTFVLNGHLNCCFKTQEAKGEQPFFFAPADSYHVPDSCDTGPGEQERTPPYPSPH